MKYLLLLLVAFGSFGLEAVELDDSPERIKALLSCVEGSGVTFIRNGKKHTAKDEADHMRKKQDHYKKDIKTPEDFIRLTATKSLVSWKKYQVETQ